MYREVGYGYATVGAGETEGALPNASIDPADESIYRKPIILFTYHELKL